MKNKIFKALKGIFSIGISVTLIGCSTSSSSTSEQVESSEQIVITMWHYYNNNLKDILDRQIQQFNETIGKEKNIIVDAYAYPSVQSLPEAIMASVTNEIGASEMPDIFYAYADNALALDALGLVAFCNLTV